MYAKEIESHQKRKSPIQKCMHGIIAREACLKNIVELQQQMMERKEQRDREQTMDKTNLSKVEASQLKQEEENEKGVIMDMHFNQFVEHLHALRLFSINIVECVSVWRDHVLFAFRQSDLAENEPEPEVPFLYQGKNYLLKMRKDNSFLGMRSNPFQEHFNFTPKGDPFLIIPSCSIVDPKRRRRKKTKKKGEDKITIPIEPQILKKIKNCEQVIEAELKAHKLMNSASESQLENYDSAPGGLEQSPTLSNNGGSVLSSPMKKKSGRSVLNGQPSLNERSIAEIAAGPENESVFIPKQDPECFPTKKIANVDSDSYRAEPLKMKEQRALEFLDFYNQKCDKNMRLTYGKPIEVLQEARRGLRPTWISLRKGAKDSGLLIFNKDASILNKSRYNILQMSVTHRDGLEEAVRLSLNYIWKNTDAEELRIGLHHFDVEEKGRKMQRVDGEIKSVLKRFNFRWKQMISNAGGSRILALGLERPDEYPLEVNEINPFRINLGTVFTISEKFEPTTHDGSIDQSESFLLTPNVFIQPLI